MLPERSPCMLYAGDKRVLSDMIMFNENEEVVNGECESGAKYDVQNQEKALVAVPFWPLGFSRLYQFYSSGSSFHLAYGYTRIYYLDTKRQLRTSSGICKDGLHFVARCDILRVEVACSRDQ